MYMSSSIFTKILSFINRFIQKDSSSGLLLMFAACLAIIMKNSDLHWLYESLLKTPVEIRIGALIIAKPLLLWINDGLMAIFFMLIGLEVKREVLEGELSRLDQIMLPGIGAIGGMAVPAAIYYLFNQGHADAMVGWAIPTATDIAFALGVLALLGNRVPASLRIFLMALAIFDDLGAIIIIAIFYTTDLSVTSLVVAAIAISLLIAMNRLNVTRISAYVIVGTIIWIAVLKSGVHATLAGVIIGLAIPLRNTKNPDHSPSQEVEHDLHHWVAFAIVPIFAFANAGVLLSGPILDKLTNPVPLGIIAGLFIGKQLGIMLFCGFIILMGWARLPSGSSWIGFYGVAVLCGIGFTMSLFISSLAFAQTGPVGLLASDRLGILFGSCLSAIFGYAILRLFNPSSKSG